MMIPHCDNVGTAATEPTVIATAAPDVVSALASTPFI